MLDIVLTTLVTAAICVGLLVGARCLPPMWRHRRWRRWDRIQALRGSLYEEITYLDGYPAGSICYSWQHRRWAATWNCIPHADDAEHYVFPTRGSAVAALAHLFPRHGGLRPLHIDELIRLRGRLAREAWRQHRRDGYRNRN